MLLWHPFTLKELKKAERRDHTLPHPFSPRRHGSPKACEVCGAVAHDPIHIKTRKK